jgi:hypothetical protein
VIKLKDILSEISVTDNVWETGNLWPFASSEELASDWEDSRLANLFGGSLKGWMLYTGQLGPDTIMKNNDIAHTISHQRAGVASNDVRTHKDHKVVKLMYDPIKVDGYAHHRFQPDPEKKYTIPKVKNPNKKF